MTKECEQSGPLHWCDRPALMAENDRLRAEAEALRASRGELLEALRNLAHHAERANEIALREVGIGVCDINAISAARAAIAKAEAGNA